VDTLQSLILKKKCIHLLDKLVTFRKLRKDWQILCNYRKYKILADIIEYPRHIKCYLRFFIPLVLFYWLPSLQENETFASA